jgi:hypothetical protein
MGRTLPSAAMVFQTERAHYAPFLHALSHSDRQALEEVFIYAQTHVAEAAYAAHPLPMQVYLLAMILEDHKKIIAMRTRLDQIQDECGSPG